MRRSLGKGRPRRGVARASLGVAVSAAVIATGASLFDASAAGYRPTSVATASSRGGYRSSRAGADGVPGRFMSDVSSATGRVATPLVGIASTPTGLGYWLLGFDGGVFAFGDARFEGSAVGAIARGSGAAAIVPSASGAGYWVLGTDGLVLSFGDAPSLAPSGGTARVPCGPRCPPKPNERFGAAAVGLSGGGGGYLSALRSGFVEGAGAEYAFYQVPVAMNSAVTGIAAAPVAYGGWVVGGDGGVFAFGDARFYGSAAPLHPARPTVAIAATPSGRGYWLLGGDGGVFAFGDARYLGTVNSR